MMDGVGGTMGAGWIVGLLFAIVLVLVIAALVKYLIK